MLSMSKFVVLDVGLLPFCLQSLSMKHDAIIEQGIPIKERVPIPDELIPADSRVEIDAKIHAGYCIILSVWSHSSGQLTSNSYYAQGDEHERAC